MLTTLPPELLGRVASSLSTRDFNRLLLTSHATVVTMADAHLPSAKAVWMIAWLKNQGRFIPAGLQSMENELRSASGPAPQDARLEGVEKYCFDPEGGRFIGKPALDEPVIQASLATLLGQISAKDYMPFDASFDQQRFSYIDRLFQLVEGKLSGWGGLEKPTSRAEALQIFQNLSSVPEWVSSIMHGQDGPLPYVRDPVSRFVGSSSFPQDAQDLQGPLTLGGRPGQPRLALRMKHLESQRTGYIVIEKRLDSPFHCWEVCRLNDYFADIQSRKGSTAWKRNLARLVSEGVTVELSLQTTRNSIRPLELKLNVLEAF